jgi:hypothetical protein
MTIWFRRMDLPWVDRGNRLHLESLSHATLRWFSAHLSLTLAVAEQKYPQLLPDKSVLALQPTATEMMTC